MQFTSTRATLIVSTAEATGIAVTLTAASTTSLPLLGGVAILKGVLLSQVSTMHKQ